MSAKPSDLCVCGHEYARHDKYGCQHNSGVTATSMCRCSRFRAMKGKKEEAMTEKDYWRECIEDAMTECGATLTKDQLFQIADAVQGAHENYGMAFYSPPPGERSAAIEDEWKEKVARLQKELDTYRKNAETAIKQALHQHPETKVSIGKYGEVTRTCGRTERIQ